MTAFATAMQYYEKGELRHAIPFFHQALAQEPHNVEVLYRACLTLISMRDYAGCARWLKAILPHVNATETPAWMMAGFHYNLGMAHEATGEWAEAATCYERSLEYEPEGIPPKVNLGSIQYRLGNHDEGKRLHDLTLVPEMVDHETRAMRSFVKLLRGDYLGGFAEYESRWKTPQVLSHSYIPVGCWRWKGKPLNGNRILVVGEQGVGDQMMMARYVPLIQERGGKVTLLVSGTLVRLMQASFPDVEVLPLGMKHRSAKWWVPTMSLPYVFGTTLDTIPPANCLQVGYNNAPLAGSVMPGKPSVGYCSKGNSLYMGDKDRSAPDGTFDPLLQLPGITWVNLEERAEKERFGSKDFADTAAIVSRLDVVISVDTAVAHCAGALGKPVWLLAQTAPFWNWGTPDQPGNHWYERHRLFRRRHVSDWGGVIERVKTELER